MNTHFLQRIRQAQQQKQTQIVLLLRPQMSRLPLPIQRFDDPFLPLSRMIIDAAHPYIAAVIFDMAAYLALGAAGAVALERAIAYAGSRSELLSILHVPFATPDYAAATSALAFAPDGVTVTHADLIPAYVLRHQAGVFVVGADSSDSCHSRYDPVRGVLRVAAPDYNSALQVVGDEVVYSSVGDDFAQAAAAALMSRVGRLDEQ
jgi:hypothetical protein